MIGDDAEPAALGDTPLMDRLWLAVMACLRGSLAVSSAALAVAATLGWPRTAPSELTGAQLWWLTLQAAATGAVLLRSGRRLRRSYAGALVVAFLAGVPVATALLMMWQWYDPGGPFGTWGELLGAALRFAAIEAAPAGYLVWRFARRPRPAFDFEG